MKDQTFVNYDLFLSLLNICFWAERNFVPLLSVKQKSLCHVTNSV